MAQIEHLILTEFYSYQILYWQNYEILSVSDDINSSISKAVKSSTSPKFPTVEKRHIKWISSLKLFLCFNSPKAFVIFLVKIGWATTSIFTKWKDLKAIFKISTLWPWWWRWQKQILVEKLWKNLWKQFNWKNQIFEVGCDSEFQVFSTSLIRLSIKGYFLFEFIIIKKRNSLIWRKNSCEILSKIFALKFSFG